MADASSRIDLPPDPDEMVRGIFARVSGTSLESCDVLAGRYDERIGYRPPDLETWVVRFGDEGRLDTTFLAHGWLTGIWRSISGRSYVTDIERQIHHYDPISGAWASHRVEVNLTGIWGLDDDYVMAWGLAEGGTPAVVLWDGRAWRSVDAPRELIWQIHGARKDLVFAVGDRGSIARWDGSKWTAMASGSTGTLSSVFVVDDDEVYACGTGQELLAGSAYGWTKLLDADLPLFTVFKWRDVVYVGASRPVGLSELRGRSLVPVAPSVQALDVDVRGTMLIATNTHVVESTDGKVFSGIPVEDFEDLVRGDRPSWR